MECPICFESTLHIFKNICQHSWCKKCQNKLIHHNLTNCPICRCDIYLKKELDTAKERFLWTIHGGKILPRWYRKYRKRTSNNTKKYILAH